MPVSEILNILSGLLLVAVLVIDLFVSHKMKHFVDKEEVIAVVEINGSNWKQTVKDIESL